MGEIRALPWNGRNVISTFSGGGGSSLGYRMAGCRVLLANEFIESARDCYRANCSPSTIIDARDIRTVQGAELLENVGLKAGELDILDGSPPCASFSISGKREKAWGKTKRYSDTTQRTDDLFFEYIRLIDEMQPRAFVAENVKGLVIGSAKGYFKQILRRMKASGYRVSARVLNAAWLGVPQSRQRLIFIGFREDLGIDPVHPSPLPFQYTVRDAMPTDGFVEAESLSAGYAVGREWARTKPGTSSDKYNNLCRASFDLPSPTVTTRGGDRSAASVMHPAECRKFSLQELRRICGFPDDFALTGGFEKSWERLGRAVPPVMMSHVARSVCASLDAAGVK
jgi:DNA (cytosine-5)-methyltransferase 1